MKKKGVTILAACVAVASLSLGGFGCGEDMETIRQEVEKSTDALYGKTVGLPNPYDSTGLGGRGVHEKHEIKEGLGLAQTGPDEHSASAPEGGGGHGGDHGEESGGDHGGGH